ncbi:C40 family peptidase [Rhodococcus sp. D2-41]|uniref:C40 family peptidase n=1 Tax=Speluncibacter jeojiensis TaxID=2710754 RepID=A0A9X4M1I7_9ACTN|nr:C40 family peptidase [Rhodococcus sp. D2-41]MDG3010005.1 C40 family peptidase [Rhodococcus sp. D2-41]MDG3016290.1 C40 family peptidase [Corynebacteriales bacterium D3-21]
MIPVQALAQPITQLIQAVGTGVLGGGSAASLLQAGSLGLGAAVELGEVAVVELAQSWQGQAADAAQTHATQGHRSGRELADRGESLAQIVGEASASVNRGTVELEGILQSFMTIAVATAPMIMTPPGQAVLMAAAVEHIEQALAVVARVRGELAVHAAKLPAVADQVQLPPMPDVGSLASSLMGALPTSPASLGPGSGGFQTFDGAASTSPASLSGAGYGGGQGGPLPGASGLFSGIGSMGGAGSSGGPTTADPVPGLGALPGGSSSGVGSSTGSAGGVRITLPDGSTAVAPNEKAADAVRSALSQRGVPYQWGGTDPGKGLDCSGLTKYAYGQAGVDLPRLAQDQTVGEQVSQSQIEPGDLAVWDGHVAMVIGNGEMVEAGDPVQVSRVRTDNIGMAFKGFYRPTS